MIDDNYIISLFFGKRQAKWQIIKKHKILGIKSPEYNYIMSRYNDSTCFEESLARIKNNINIRPICKNCGKPLNFTNKYSDPFMTFCCSSCSTLNEDTKTKYKNTCLEKYGVDNGAKSQISKIKYQQTCLEKYGVDNLFKSDYIKDKIKKSNIEKYGVDNPMKLKEYHDKLMTEEVKHKRYSTMRKNNTFNKSKQEEIAYEKLKKIFTNIKRQYKSDDYPFYCDFFVPDQNIYIECNFHWTHGSHPYNQGSNDDNIVEYWRNKNTKFYNNAINVWTKYDVKKREIAKQNNLNYIELFSLHDLNEYISKFTRG